MSSETLEELKAIVENAPEGANYVTLGGKQYIMIDGMHCKVFNCLGVWSIPVCNASDILIDAKVRSLSDIKRIIELMESNSKLQNKSGESFKEELLKATSSMMRPHIEGVYAVWEDQL